MNGRLSTWLLLGALLVWPSAVYGQRREPASAQRTILNLIQGEDLPPPRDLTRNWLLGFRSGTEYPGTRKEIAQERDRTAGKK
jgi:hypothetical protein